MKNFLAVIAGLAVVIVISTGLDFVMHSTGVFSMDNTEMTTAHRLIALAWRASPQLGPLWYSAVLVITAIPCTWLGGKLAKPPHG
ncbi:MAG TPA: hypothetical protein VFZ95_14675 [Steroidobacteraceae bacterium]